MLWLIWIAIMLLTPVVAGIAVWYQTHARRPEVAVIELCGEEQSGEHSEMRR